MCIISLIRNRSICFLVAFIPSLLRERRGRGISLRLLNRTALTSEILKPARYLGNEFGAARKPWDIVLVLSVSTPKNKVILHTVFV